MKQLKISEEQAFALGQKLRWRIMKLLYKKELCVSDIAKLVKDKSRNHTSTRYHVGILLDAILIKKTKMIETHGAYEKYYTATFSLRIPK